VKVGKVTAIRLAENEWVEAEFAIDRDVDLPARPAVIAASASLFGEWSANIINYEPLPTDPNVRRALVESDRAGGSAWPGATLPDIGELTAQASRIAGDVAEVTQRVQGAFDSTALASFKQSVVDLAAISRRLVTFANTQTTRVERISEDIAVSSNAFSNVSRDLERTVARIDSASAGGQFKTILENGAAATGDLRTASADFQQVMAALRANEASLVRVVQSADSLLARIQAGNGTIGKLATDSTLYYETAMTMRQMRELLADIQANPRKYIKVSVF
jgi:ABC-type transporter Mla subunit MlaD